MMLKQLSIASPCDKLRTNAFLKSQCLCVYCRYVGSIKISFGHKFCAQLCVALAFLFVSISLSSILDDMQHASGAGVAHEHSVLSDLTMEPDHADEHHVAHHDGDDDPDADLAGVHHHHWDNGSGTILLGSMSLAVPDIAGVRHERRPQQSPPGSNSSGFERPPKPIMSSV
ncbi:MAG: hypothetical protein R3D70_24830 [Rhizobiaceae bacterium]